MVDCFDSLCEFSKTATEFNIGDAFTVCFSFQTPNDSSKHGRHDTIVSKIKFTQNFSVEIVTLLLDK